MSDKLKEKADELTEVLKDELGSIELDVLSNYTLADAIREGCKVSDQERNWGDGDTACAISAIMIAAEARGYTV
jgi:hypothetical protein